MQWRHLSGSAERNDAAGRAEGRPAGRPPSAGDATQVAFQPSNFSGKLLHLLRTFVTSLHSYVIKCSLKTVIIDNKIQDAKYFFEIQPLRLKLYRHYNRVLNRGNFSLRGNFGISGEILSGGKFKDDKTLPKIALNSKRDNWYPATAVKF